MKRRKISSRILSYAIAKKCYEKKARDIVILDMKKLNYLTDYFVVCTVVADKQINAIFAEIDKYMEEKGFTLLSKDMSSDQWAIFDYSVITCHCFTKEKREFYNLESLWYDAPLVRYKGRRK
ncbi:MAG: ribosome silencing factor [Planctomycetes bacterium]|nr:ribosome silencing factor [Planctomycetota bacterium]